MPERWVVNALPFIVLANLHLGHLLCDLADEMVLPQSVVAEIQAGPTNDVARVVVDRWPNIVTPRAPDDLIAWDLGAGETAVLSFVLANPGWTAIIDDGAARKCAFSFGIPVKGTLGIIISAQ